MSWFVIYEKINKESSEDLYEKINKESPKAKPKESSTWRR